MKNQLFYILFFVSQIVLSQTSELPSTELIKELKIKSVISFLCKDSICDTSEIFMQWEFDKNGNMILEMLGDETDTSYIEFYYYDNSQKLILKKGLGDFLCHKQSKRLIDTTFTYYKYNEVGYLKSEIKQGGCCDLEIIYEYLNNHLAKKTYNNEGCKFHGYMGEIFMTYNENGLIETEKNNIYKSHRKYIYNNQSKIDSILERRNEDNKIYSYIKFKYEDNSLVEEIEYQNNIENDSPYDIGTSYKYHYDKYKLIIEISEEEDDEIISRLIYKYNYY